MPKLQHFEIEFDNPSAVYYSGTNLGGKVVVVLSEAMEMRGVRLRFTGRARTQWTRTTGSGSHSTTHHYQSEECYINVEATLYGKQRGDDGPNPQMPAGTNTFAFSFQIPPSCPSSFEAGYGNIRYLVEAEIDRPWRFDHKTKHPFTVISLVDLNNDPRAAQSIQSSNQKTVGCMCFTSGQVSCKIMLPKTGYVPGEVVALNGEIVNGSSRQVGPATMKLIQLTVFTASCGSSTEQKSEEVVLAQAVKEAVVDPGGSQIWNNEGLCLPPVPPTMAGCRFIAVYYRIEFKIPCGLVSSLTCVLPITVGSVPLRQQIPQFQQAYRQYSVDAGVGMPGGAAVQPNAPLVDTYPELPPPAYPETSGGRVSIRDDTDNEYTRGRMEYAPKYAYYDWGSVPADQTTISLVRQG